MTFDFQRIEGSWVDRPVYIIGGGPSLVGFDFKRIRGLGVLVGVNRSAFIADTDVLVTLDRMFARNFRDDVARFVDSGKEAVLAMVPNEDTHEPISGATYVTARRNRGLSDDPRDLRGVNSGYAALGLAYLRRAKEIALLGFDFQWTGGKSHFHSGYRWQNKNAHRMLNRWATDFELAGQQLAEIGANVVNYVGPQGSMVKAFPVQSLGEL